MILSNNELNESCYIKWNGRTYFNVEKEYREIYHTGSGFTCFFQGSNVSSIIRATNTNNEELQCFIVIVIDDDFLKCKTIRLTEEVMNLFLYDSNYNKDDTSNIVHKLSVYKRTESTDSHFFVESISTDGSFIKLDKDNRKRIEFISDSASVGYGNLKDVVKTTETSDGLKAYPFQTAINLNCDFNIFSASGFGALASIWTNPHTLNVYENYNYVDFGSKILWNHSDFKPDLIVLNLGTNDASYVYEVDDIDTINKRKEAFEQRYYDFLMMLHNIHPNAKILSLYGVMNESNIYDSIKNAASKARNNIGSLYQVMINGDGKGYNLHPSAKSGCEVSEKLVKYIKDNKLL